MIVLFLHGSHHGPWVYKNLELEFKKINIETISLNLLGHENCINDDKKKYTVDEYVLDLYEKYPKNENVVIVSHSFGCYIICKFLLKYNYIKPIKIFFLAPYLPSICSWYMTGLYYFYPFIINNVTFQNVKDAFFNSGTNDEIIQYCYDNLKKINVNDIKIKEYFLNIDFNEYSNIYILGGENDRIIPPNIINKIRNKCFMNSKYKIITNVGHDMMLDNNWIDVFNYIKNNIN